MIVLRPCCPITRFIFFDLMRSMVSEIREPDVQSEIALAERVLSSSGISCTVAMEANASLQTPTGSGPGSYGEGVTNVLRHSGAASCRIEVQANREARDPSDRR